MTPNPQLALYLYDPKTVDAVLTVIQKASLGQIEALGSAYHSVAGVDRLRLSIAVQLEVSRLENREVYSLTSDAWVQASKSFQSDCNDDTCQNLVSSFPALIDAISAVILS